MAHASLDATAVARIVRATGLDVTDIDYQKLGSDLESNLTVSMGIREATGPKVAKHTEKQLGSIARAAKRLKALLPQGHDDPVWTRISANLDIRESDPRTGLDRLIAAVDKALPPPGSEANRRVGGLLTGLSAFEIFAGLGLPRIFEDHFKCEATLRRRSNGELYGPYISFALRALIELGFTANGKPYSAESIARAKRVASRRRTPRRALGKNRKKI